MVATPAAEVAAATVEEAVVAVMMAEVAASEEAVASVVEEEEDSPVAEALAMPLSRRQDVSKILFLLEITIVLIKLFSPT